jgi:hypothetical protein
VPAASPADRMASASVAARRVKVTVSLSVPTDRALCRSYRPPSSRRSRSSMTWRSSCRAWSTCPGAWPRSQLSATRALYRGPEGSGGDLFGCSDTVGKARLRQFAAGTRERTEPPGRPVPPHQPPPPRGRTASAPAPRKNDRPRPWTRSLTSPRRSRPAPRFRYEPLRPRAGGNPCRASGAQVEQSASIPPEVARLFEGLGQQDRSSRESVSSHIDHLLGALLRFARGRKRSRRWGWCPVAGSAVDDGCPTKRVANFARVDSIESRMGFEAGPAANNLGPESGSTPTRAQRDEAAHP